MDSGDETAHKIGMPIDSRANETRGERTGGREEGRGEQDKTFRVCHPTSTERALTYHHEIGSSPVYNLHKVNTINH